MREPDPVEMLSLRKFCMAKLKDSPDCGRLPVDPCREYKVLEADTREVIQDFLMDFSGFTASYGRRGPVVQTMRRVVDGLVEKHGTVYKGMIKKLDDRDIESIFTSVAKDVFSDGLTNWGRIASLLAFGAVVCKHQTELGRGQCVKRVADEISSFLLSDKRDWLLKNNAWDGFVEFFHVPDPEATMRNTLMTFLTIAGLGAGIAFLSR